MMIVVAFAIVCVPVFLVALALFVRAVLLAMRLSQRAQAMVPHSIIAQLHFAQIDAKRTAQSFKAIAALTPRAAVASASIVASIERYRATIARLRG